MAIRAYRDSLTYRERQVSVKLTAGGIVAGMPVDMSWYGLGVVTPIAVEANGKFTRFRFEGDPSLYTTYTSTTFNRCDSCAVWVPDNTGAMHSKSCVKPRCVVISATEMWDETPFATRVSVIPGKPNHTGTYKSTTVEQIWAQLNSNQGELYIPIRNR